MPRYNPQFEALKTYPQQALEARKADIRRKGIKLYDLGWATHEPAPGLSRLCAVNVTSMWLSLGERIRCGHEKHFRRRYGPVDFEQHICPVWRKKGVFHMPLLVIDPKAEDRLVVFAGPGYPAYYRGAIFAGADLMRSHSRKCIFGRGLCLSLCFAAPLLWLNSPHNPSGRSCP